MSLITGKSAPSLLFISCVGKICYMSQDETVEHLILKCQKHARNRREMLSVVTWEIVIEGWDE